MVVNILKLLSWLQGSMKFASTSRCQLAVSALVLSSAGCFTHPQGDFVILSADFITHVIHGLHFNGNSSIFKRTIRLTFSSGDVNF